MSYAKYTKVPVEKSQWDIVNILKKYGAKGFMMDFENYRLGFQIRNRNVLLHVNPPNRSEFSTENQYNQAIRAQWRAYLLIIKAKFVAIESKITTFDNEFMASFILKNGRTLSEHILPQLDQPDIFPKLPEGNEND